MRETIQRLREYGSHIKAMVALALLVLAGALIGATLTSAHYRDTLQQEREVNRGMFVDLTDKLDAIGKRLDGTASKQAATATQLQDATATVGEVVEKADLAAAKADKAAKLAAAKATAKAPAAPPAAVQPEVVNSEVRKANEKIKGLK